MSPQPDTLYHLQCGKCDGTMEDPTVNPNGQRYPCEECCEGTVTIRLTDTMIEAAANDLGQSATLLIRSAVCAALEAGKP